MVKLAAVIITKDEERRIKSCLDSLKGFVDEIVVVDDCSRDKTVDICQEYGARVTVNRSEGNFDQQRNIGIDNSTGEWIIQMDADEIVPEAAAKKIITAIEDPGEFTAFTLRRKNFFFNHPLEGEVFFDTGMIKVFKKGTARYVGRSVHETLEAEGSAGKIDGEVFHYPYSSMAEIITKVNFYTDVIAKNFVEDNESITLREIKYQLSRKSLKHFWKLYMRKRARKEGIYGLIWSILKVMVPWLKWVKIWELAKTSGKLKVDK